MDYNINNTIKFDEYISLYPYLLGIYWNNIQFLNLDTVLTRLKIPYNKNQPL